MYYGGDAADRAEEHFQQTVVEGGVPDDIPEYAPETEDAEEVGLLNLMRYADLTESNSEGRRMIEQGAVTINEETVTDTGRYIDVAAEAPFVLQVGKRRFARIVPAENGGK